MQKQNLAIQIIAAPSILGLRPTGVENLAGALLSAGLPAAIRSTLPVIELKTLNHLYSEKRDASSNCLNTEAMVTFSKQLAQVTADTISANRFAVVLGGDCSILLGTMIGLKMIGDYGLLFIDAHADFYLPEQSPTGEVADMDLAIVTGNGPGILADINEMRPYVKAEHVVHIGQRDAAETKKYGARDIRETGISCYDLATIRIDGVQAVAEKILKKMNDTDTAGYWIHFDTDVLADEINPAVDYRLPGGLQFEEAAYFLQRLLLTARIKGISISIFNPSLDLSGLIAKNIVTMLGKSFNSFGA